MTDAPEKYQKELDRIKKNVEQAHKYYEDNYKRFANWTKYIYEDQLTQGYREQLSSLKKPDMQFNVCESYISKLVGEFARNEIGIKVLSDYNSTVPSQVIEVLEGHFRHILDDAQKKGILGDAYETTLSGGMDTFKIWTEFLHERSFDQVIKLGRTHSPTLTFFDPLARLPHKGDADYCGEIFPVSKEAFEKEYPKTDIEKVAFAQQNSFGDFCWSYQNKAEKVLLKCDYYEKKIKKVKILKLADSPRLGNGLVVTPDEYEDLKRSWKTYKFPEPIPAIADEREADQEIICRYKIIENRVLKYEELDYKYFPLIFIKGSGKIIQDSADGAVKEVIRPYLYNAKGMQDLMNFSGNTLGQELSNIIQHQFHIYEEALPTADAYVEAYKNPQLSSILVSKAYADKDQSKPLAPPTVIQRQAIMPEISQTFLFAPQTIQSILGAYDAATVQGENPIISGKSIEKGAIQSNSAALPFMVNFLTSLQRVMDSILDLIPKYYLTPRTIPVLNKEGKRSYVEINTEGGIKMSYDPNVLQVRLELGTSFAIQQDSTIRQIAQLCQAIPGFGDFIHQEGLEFILKNLHINGAEALMEKAEAYKQKLAQQMQMQQEMAQQQMMMNPLMLKVKNDQARLQLDAQKQQANTELEAGKLALGKEELDLKKVELIAELQRAEQEALLAADKHDAEKIRAAVDLLIKQLQYKHSRERDINAAHHDIRSEALAHERHMMNIMSDHAKAERAEQASKASKKEKED